MQRERPILFSDLMVRSVMEDRKTQTRREMKNPIGEGTVYNPLRMDLMKCPFGQVGDHLWVRETHYRFGHWEPVVGVKTKGGRQKWKFVADSSRVRYADNPPTTFRKSRDKKTPEIKSWHKRLGRFMPKTAKRTTLKITGLRVERLQHITEDDAKAEGPYQHQNWPKEYYCHWTTAFRELWKQINGEESWDKNPWVWVVEFERLKP